MENLEETSIEQTPAPQPKWFHNAWLSRGTLLIAGLFFLLPFININCSGNKLASIRGTDMVFGSELKPAIEKTEDKIANMPSAESSDSSAENSGAAIKNDDPFGNALGDKSKSIEPNALAIIAFGSVLLAFIFSFFSKRVMAITSAIFSTLALLSLFFIQTQIQNEFQKQMGPMNFIPITFEFTSFYWLCLLFLLTASVFSFVRSSFKSV